MKHSCLLPALAVCTATLASCLSANAKPPLIVLEHPSPEELEQGFQNWAEQYPRLFCYEKRGVTPEGRPILMGRITDSSVSNDDKQIALLTSCHVAKELNAGTGLLRFMKWLLGDDPQAAKIRKRQIVLVVPYTDPDGIASGELKKLREIYGSPQRIWSYDGVSDPQGASRSGSTSGNHGRIPARTVHRLSRAELCPTDHVGKHGHLLGIGRLPFVLTRRPRGESTKQRRNKDS